MFLLSESIVSRLWFKTTNRAGRSIAFDGDAAAAALHELVVVGTTLLVVAVVTPLLVVVATGECSF